MAEKNSEPLEVVRVIGFTPDVVVLVRCFCNKFFTAFESSVKSGKTLSCGCLNKKKENSHSIHQIRE